MRHLLHRFARGRAVAAARPAEWDHAHRGDRQRQAEDPAGRGDAPQRQGDQGCAEAHRPGGQQQILHARIDRTEERRLADERRRQIGQPQPAPQARNHQHRDLAEMIDLPLHRAQDLGHRLVSGGEALADPAVHRPALAIALAEPVLDPLILDDEELPVLSVRTGGCPQGQFDALQHDRVVDGVAQHPAHRALGHHGVEQRHVQPGQRLGGRRDRIRCIGHDRRPYGRRLGFGRCPSPTCW